MARAPRAGRTRKFRLGDESIVFPEKLLQQIFGIGQVFHDQLHFGIVNNLAGNRLSRGRAAVGFLCCSSARTWDISDILSNYYYIPLVHWGVVGRWLHRGFGVR